MPPGVWTRYRANKLGAAFIDSIGDEIRAHTPEQWDIYTSYLDAEIAHDYQMGRRILPERRDS